MPFLTVSFLRSSSRKFVAIIPILMLIIPMCQFGGHAHAGEIEVTWSSVTLADGYKLYYGFESRSYDFAIDVGPKLQHKISELEDNTRYYLAVTAYNEHGESDFSFEISTQTIANTGEPLLGNSQVFSKTTTNDSRRAVLYTMPEDGFIQTISMYHNGGSGKMMLGVYADDGLGNPGNQLALTGETNVNSTEGWQSIELNTPVYALAGTPIWLAWVYENNPGVRYQEGSSERAQSDGIWDGGMPYAYGPSSIGEYVYSINATYLPDAIGNSQVFSNTTSAANRRAMPYAMAEDGTILSISMYHDGGLGKMLLGLYADDGQGYPGRQIAVTQETSVNSAQGWQTIKLTGPAFIPADAPIWLAWVFEKNPGIHYKIDSPGRALADETWSGGMPVAYGSSTIENYSYSINAAYIPGAAIFEDIGNTEVFPNTTRSDARRAMVYTMPEDGYIHSMSIYHDGGSGKLLLGLYADDGYNNPGKRLMVTAETVVSSIEGWQSLDLITPAFIPSGSRIWLAWVFENNPGIRYKSGTPGRANSDELWIDGMPANYGLSTIKNFIYSIYASYTPMSANEQ